MSKYWVFKELTRFSSHLYTFFPSSANDWRATMADTLRIRLATAFPNSGPSKWQQAYNFLNLSITPLCNKKTRLLRLSCK